MCRIVSMAFALFTVVKRFTYVFFIYCCQKSTKKTYFTRFFDLKMSHHAQIFGVNMGFVYNTGSLPHYKMRTEGVGDGSGGWRKKGACTFFFSKYFFYSTFWC